MEGSTLRRWQASQRAVPFYLPRSLTQQSHVQKLTPHGISDVRGPEIYKHEPGTNSPNPSKRQDQSSPGLFNATKTTGWPSSLKGADSKIACKQIGRLGTREHHQVI